MRASITQVRGTQVGSRGRVSTARGIQDRRKSAQVASSGRRQDGCGQESEKRALADKRKKEGQAKGAAWMSLVRLEESFDLCGGSGWLLGQSRRGQRPAGLRRKEVKFKGQKAYIELSPFPLFSLESHQAHCLSLLVGLPSAPLHESSAPTQSCTRNLAQLA